LSETATETLSARQRVGLVLGPALFALLMAADFGGQPETHRLAAVAALMATWWITEAIQIPATALLPLVLFPLLGIMDADDTARQYANSPIFLFVGGFILALATERWGLHRRIALGIIAAIGESPRRLVLGFMAATAALSMWISNTATTMMLLPIGLSVTALARRRAGDDAEGVAPFSTALMLGIAYGASIGGVATLIGTPPNIVFQEIYAQEFPGAADINFFSWFQVGLPVSLIFFFIAWAVLLFLVFDMRGMRGFGGSEVIRRERAELGPMTRPEKGVAVVFALTALLWISRREIDLGITALPGWSNLLPEAVRPLLHDATVAMAAALVLFLLPAGDGTGRRLMNWETAERIPYGIIFLFGGGFALAAGFKASGLSLWLFQVFSESPLAHGSPVVLVGGIATGMTFLTELTSNTATTNLALPVLAELGRALPEVDPLTVMIPATVSASFAFMLPVATPPNMIVFGSGQVKMMDMVKAGLVLNLIGIVLVVTVVGTLIPVVF
jgi:sodium-dependent dicarboxylate transporter 2/3/5